ncbi:MAG: leucine-rich repeat domain-containing protein, partial [Clostridia bacterium]|nr:leucine-rich repeat domain-containing protein [Clostridia bacterium]
APTCTEEGYTLNVCSCGDNYKTDTVNSLGHDYADEWTIDLLPACTEKGSKSKHCSRCESAAEVTAIPETGHSFGEWLVTKQPECVINGFQMRVCANCNTSQGKSIPSLGGHKYGEWERFAERTCTEQGANARTCGVCGQDETEYEDALGHDYSEEFTVDLQPDCTEVGSKSKHCSRCESTEEVTEIPANGHSYGDWETITEISCTEQGVKERTCGVCGYDETEYEDALGHDIEYIIDEYYHKGECNRCNLTVQRAHHAFEGTVCAGCNYKVHPTQGLEYKLNSDGLSYSIKGIGKATDVNDLVIFGEYSDLPVTKIEERAFMGNTNLQSVCIYGIEQIPYGAFMDCVNIEKIVLPDTLTNLDRGFGYYKNLAEIRVDSENSVFYSKDDVYLIETESKTLLLSAADTIPADGSVTVIGNFAFGERSSLTELKIPNTITKIDSNAFDSCSELKTVEIPSTVKSVGGYALATCKSLTSIEIADGVETIAACAFKDTAITEIVIPNTVTEIANA